MAPAPITPHMATWICSTRFMPKELGAPAGSSTTHNAAMKAKEEPRNTGFLPPVHRWNTSVPRPAASRATPTSRPVSRGTRMVAQLMAKACWKPSATALPAPTRSYVFAPGNRKSFSFLRPFIRACSFVLMCMQSPAAGKTRCRAHTRLHTLQHLQALCQPQK